MATIIYLIGLIVTIFAIIDVSKKTIPTAGKVMCCILLLITSWIGIIIYFIFVRSRITKWFSRDNEGHLSVQETTKRDAQIHEQGEDLPHYIKIDD